MSLADCLKMEYRLAANIVDSPAEFDEGIRALLIDKDSKPKWKPDDLRKVTFVRLEHRIFCMHHTSIFQLAFLSESNSSTLISAAQVPLVLMRRSARC